MHDYALYVEDDRYSIPTLLFVTARDAASVRRLARQKLQDNPHHLSVAVYDGDRPLFKVAPPILVSADRRVSD